MSRNLQMLVHASVAHEVALPPPPRLTFTRNFTWVFVSCLAALAAAPLLVAWTAGLMPH